MMPVAVHDSKAVVSRFYQEIFNEGKLEVIPELVADDFVDHIPHPLPVQPSLGRRAVEWSVSQFRQTFPDLHITIEDTLAAGNKVAVRTMWHGTHRGQFLGLAPTGKEIYVMGLDIVRVANGKIVEHWGQLDVLDMMAQLGLLPSSDETTL